MYSKATHKVKVFCASVSHRHAPDLVGPFVCHPLKGSSSECFVVLLWSNFHDSVPMKSAWRV